MKCVICGDKIIGRYLTDQHGNVYCSNTCYRETLPTCKVCGEKMEQWTEDEKGNKYCSEECFKSILPKCKVCGKRMNQWTEDEKGNRYCSQECYKESWPKCKACNRPMDHWIEDDEGNKFCGQECYESALPTCNNCGMVMKKWVEDSKGNKYCSKMCREENTTVVKSKSTNKKPQKKIMKGKPINLSADINHRKIIYRYDLLDINNSEIRYGEAIKDLVSCLLDGMDIYEDSKKDIIKKYMDIQLKLKKKRNTSTYLDEREKSFFDNRNEFVINALKFETRSIRSYLEELKQKGEILENETVKTNTDFSQKYPLNDEPRIKFEVLVEKTLKYIQEKIKRNDFLERMYTRNVYNNELEKMWADNFKLFKSSIKDEFKNLCELEGIEEKRWIKWFDDWKKKRLIVESCLQPLLEKEFTMIENPFNDNFMKEIYTLVSQYKSEIDEFYMNERLFVYQKFAFDVGGELKEKLEVEYMLYSINMIFQEKFQKLIFDLEDVEKRAFLMKWSYVLLDMQIDELIDYVGDGIESSISNEIIVEFTNLKKKRLEDYLLDAEAYSKEVKNREKEFNSLIYRMRSDLEKIQ